MWYYFKNALLGFIYLIFMGIIAFGISYINSIPAMIVLCVLNLGFYCFVLFMLFKKEGETAMNIRYSNDVERMRMIETNQLRTLKLKEEYKPYKGFLIGFIICIPLIVCLTVHLILGLALGKAYCGGGVVGGVMYLAFYWTFAMFFVRSGSTVTALPWGMYFILLYAVAVIVLTIGIGYLLGAKKSVKQHELIKEKQRQIYGDK